MRRLFSTVALLLAAVLGTVACAAGVARELTGDLAVHDPALAQEEDGTWFVYSTGAGTVADGNVQIRSSEDGAHWTYRGEVWQEKPAWMRERIQGVDNLWAPELIEHDGTWYLYYSASRFGENTSLIALATNTTLDPDDPAYEWVDRGVVIESGDGDPYNAIDPGFVVDDAGVPWMAFGSFWSGIRMVELEWPSGVRAGTEDPLHLADRGAPPNAIEAPYIVERGGEYFLFLSRDSCCRGVESTYNIAVGRSDTPQGPYVDRDGTPLLEDGGTPMLATEGERIGPGGQSVWGDTLAIHYYDGGADGVFRLALLPITWEDDGWPTVSW